MDSENSAQTPQQPSEEEVSGTTTEQHSDATAPSEDTGGSSPESPASSEAPAPEAESDVDAAEPVATEDTAPLAAGVEAGRPFAGSTNPKTAPVPQPGVPLAPVNPTRDDSAPAPAVRPSSRIGEALERKKAQRQESISG